MYALKRQQVQSCFCDWIYNRNADIIAILLAAESGKKQLFWRTIDAVASTKSRYVFSCSLTLAAGILMTMFTVRLSQQMASQ